MVKWYIKVELFLRSELKIIDFIRIMENLRNETL